jgi:hypothetical protein
MVAMCIRQYCGGLGAEIARREGKPHFGYIETLLHRSRNVAL